MRLCSRRRPSRSPRPRRALPSDPLPSTTKKQALEEKEGEEEEEEEEEVVGKEVFLLLPGHSPRGRGLPQGRVSILAHTTSTPTTLPTLPYVVMCVVECGMCVVGCVLLLFVVVIVVVVVMAMGCCCCCCCCCHDCGCCC